MEITSMSVSRRWKPVAAGLGLAMLGLVSLVDSAAAEQKADKVFYALATDAKGVETEVRNLLFYWEEKVSETSFVPHELKEMPVKRGTATVKIKFDSIKTVEVKPSANGTLPAVTVTLNDGKTGEFTLAIPGSFKGQSDFGEVELPVMELKRLVFK